MPTPTTTITDSKFNALKVKLRELFELDKSDLDFGIYRIIAAKNKEVTEFLDRQLKDVVRGTLAAHGNGAADQVQAELDKAIAQAHALGADPETLPKVRELRAKLESAGGAASADLEADIYNHLLAFFGRYYDEGDFISQRRYKGDTYAIPYSGEEVTLHWANKDQYYIKSGEWHKDYRFKIPGGGDKTVRFKLVEATQEVGNNKEADDSKRRYILASDNPVEELPSELALRFEFRVPKPADTELAENGAVSIFGGDYAKATSPKKGDERDRFCADAEKRAVAAMSAAWKAVVAVPSATDDKPARTVLGKHLDDFTARNTFDYFIHKDLGGFLGRELDFYIKNEVVRLDDLETLPADHLQRVQGKVKAIRIVASRLIAFLGSLEDFQLKMWLKKKFVLNTNWLVTVDRVPQRLRDVVAANAAQWAEWERLGFKPEATGNAGLFGGAVWGTRAYLDACDKLVIDTNLFSEDFKADVLASEEVLHGAPSVASAITGSLFHGDNFQTVSLLGARYRRSVQYIYIDPPYNAKTSEILYKNTFKHSAWLSMMANRLAASSALRASDGCLTVAIDENEQQRLEILIKESFPLHEVACIAVVHNPAGVQGRNFSYCHESALFAYPAEGEFIGYTTREDDLVSQLRDWGGTSARSLAKNCFYPILVRDGKIVGFGGRCDDDFHPGRANIRDGDTVSVYPVEGSVETGDYEERKWVFSCNSVEANADQLFVRTDGDEVVIMRRKSLRKYRTVWDDKRYYANIYGSKLLSHMMGALPFPFPKSVYLVEDSIKAVTSVKSSGSLVLDFFGGSGTTGHAVINLNRRDQGSRQFVLVEMGDYFQTVLKPRITKAVFASEWRDGKAQPVASAMASAKRRVKELEDQLEEVKGIEDRAEFDFEKQRLEGLIEDQATAIKLLEEASRAASNPTWGASALIPYCGVESYEDALNNLPTPSGHLLDGRSEAERDALVTYALDLELGPRLLDLDAFRDPWGYTIKAQLAGDAEIKRHRVDLVETFNYLIGLKVHAYGPLERYSADFERAAHADGLGKLRVKTWRGEKLVPDPNGPLVFQRIEGELNDGNDTRVLVVWRKLTDDPEKDAAALDAWMARHRETTRERTEHRDYHLIYINGPVTLPQPTAEIRTVFPTEETFKTKMFEDADSASQMGGV